MLSRQRSRLQKGKWVLVALPTSDDSVLETDSVVRGPLGRKSSDSLAASSNQEVCRSINNHDPKPALMPSVSYQQVATSSIAKRDGYCDGAKTRQSKKVARSTMVVKEGCHSKILAEVNRENCPKIESHILWLLANGTKSHERWMSIWSQEGLIDTAPSTASSRSSCFGNTGSVSRIPHTDY